ncbi:hypothetical protein BDP27DRAFT_1260678 [Rhodocollybia butyracea]|uniref:RRM domain-containing protein n=1 Tax=Rhodocollybia butyracea TaxID=206335 RepID=A0A9P5Q028_9AGAR|nr:hypothetical protein BDP27DRAFT_1260678 [Rhodocollybia butyracea]
MHAQNQARPLPYQYARYNSYHGPKQRVLGNQAQVAPAWRYTGSSPMQTQAMRRQQAIGSKILLTQLPLDVGEREVEELFNKTVGPLKESFLIYNSQGKSKGMAVVVFQRPGDAAVARTKYDGKFVDGRRPIRIEIVSESTPVPTNPSSTSVSATQPSLLDRLDKPKRAVASTSSAQSIQNHKLPRQAAAAAAIAAGTPFANPSQPQIPAHTKHRTKKGPRRLKKQNVQMPRFTKTKTKEQLDQEMEEYRAAS